VPEVIAVTGLTGGIGSRVAQTLIRQGYSPRLLGRDASKARGVFKDEIVQCSYDDQPSMAAALTGASSLLFVSGREHVDRLAHHRSVISAASEADIRKIVYTSFLGAHPKATFTLARQHFETEQLIRRSGAEFVILRDSMYADYLPFLAGADGVIRGPAGSGRASFVTRDDVAESAVAVLTTDAFDGQTLDITGPEAISMGDAAALLTEISGRRVAYVQESAEEAYASRAHYGAPDWEVEGWVSSYQAIANGEMETISNAVETLTFHRARTVRDFLTAHPESYAHLKENEAGASP
jgi:uncharacterized protein YbjT (DUF2867 family)